MKVIKRELLLCLALTAFVFVCALAWGNPFLAAGPAGSAITHSQAATARVFEGTVMRHGDQFLLRETSGQSFRIDNAQGIRAFEGKSVTVTGKFDAAAGTIHVERIESATV